MTIGIIGSGAIGASFRFGDSDDGGRERLDPIRP
jgi:hypothetical protein